MDAAQARVATGAAAQALLATLPPYDPASALASAARLRESGVEPQVAAAALTQSRLRAQARQKFGEFADGMAFTPDGLEQATRLTVAALHAERYLRAGTRRVADITAGIGADAMALAAVGLDVMAFERDEATALVADHNLRHWPASVVVLADGLATVRDVDVDAVYADPARRSARGRRHRPEDYEPPLPDVLALRDRYEALGVKVGPAIAHADLPADAEAQWVSVDGDVVEAGIWCGPLATHVGRGALVVAAGRATEVRDSGARADTRPLGDFLYEPDGAVIRAGLVAEVARDLSGGLVDPTIAYVTADAATATPLAAGYRVLDALPFSVKALRALLRVRGVGRLTVKKRGTAVTPEALRAQLGLRGPNEATVILTRLAGRQSAVLVEPLSQGATSN